MHAHIKTRHRQTCIFIVRIFYGTGWKESPTTLFWRLISREPQVVRKKYWCQSLGNRILHMVEWACDLNIQTQTHHPSLNNVCSESAARPKAILYRKKNKRFFHNNLAPLGKFLCSVKPHSESKSMCGRSCQMQILISFRLAGVSDRSEPK